MSWGKLEDTFRDHWKPKRLAAELGVSRAEARGLLAGLWSWAVGHAPDGDLSQLTEIEIEEAADWQGESGKFVSVACSDHVSVLERTKHGLVIHDFMERAESNKVATRKRKEREKRRKESTVSRDTSATVTATSKTCHAAEERRREERRGEERINTVVPAPPPAPAGTTKGRSAEQQARSKVVNRRYRERYEEREGHPPAGTDQQFNGIIARFSDKYADAAILILDWFFDSPDNGMKRSGWAPQLLFDQAPRLWRELNDKRKALENIAAPAQARIAARNASLDIEVERANEILAKELAR